MLVRIVITLTCLIQFSVGVAQKKFTNKSKPVYNELSKQSDFIPSEFGLKEHTLINMHSKYWFDWRKTRKLTWNYLGPRTDLHVEMDMIDTNEVKNFIRGYIKYDKRFDDKEKYRFVFSLFRTGYITVDYYTKSKFKAVIYDRKTEKLYVSKKSGNRMPMYIAALILLEEKRKK